MTRALAQINDVRDTDEDRRPSAKHHRRRRRERHFRRLRRDATIDLGVALLLMTFTLIVTAGLGVVALLEMPVGAAVVGSFVIERRGRH